MKVFTKHKILSKATNLSTYMHIHMQHTQVRWLLIRFTFTIDFRNCVLKFAIKHNNNNVVGELCNLAWVTGPRVSPTPSLQSDAACQQLASARWYKRQCLPSFCTMCWKVLVYPTLSLSLHAEKCWSTPLYPTCWKVLVNPTLSLSLHTEKCSSTPLYPWVYLLKNAGQPHFIPHAEKRWSTPLYPWVYMLKSAGQPHFIPESTCWKVCCSSLSYYYHCIRGLCCKMQACMLRRLVLQSASIS